MIRVGWAHCCAIGFLLILLLCGCVPVNESQLDEQKEPNFIAGKNLLSQMDYEGAVESFEKAIEVNPHSASAHYELGCLYDQNFKKPNDAIYHYTRYLRYSRPSGEPVKGHKPNEREEIVQQRINGCMADMLKGVATVGGPVSTAAQRELDRLTQENKNLNAKIDVLQQQLVAAQQALTTVLKNRNAQISTPGGSGGNRIDNSSNPSRSTPPSSGSGRTDHMAPSSEPGSIHPPSHSSGGGRMLSYTVKAGDTIAGIARRQGISKEALLAANPQVNAAHLTPGKSINVPSR